MFLNLRYVPIKTRNTWVSMHMSEYITINNLKFLLLFGLKFLAQPNFKAKCIHIQVPDVSKYRV